MSAEHAEAQPIHAGFGIGSQALNPKTGVSGSSVAPMRTEIITPPEWRAALSGYLAWLAAARRPKSTQYLRSYHLRRFAATTGLTPRLVTHDDLITYLGSHTWSDSTAHAARSTFRSFYLWAHRVAGIVESNPAELLPSMRPGIGAPRPASQDALDHAMSTADDRVRFMVLFAATMGLRCCEIAKVHTGDFFEDPEDGLCLRIVGKGKKIRDVPVSAQVKLRLRTVESGTFLFPGNVGAGHLSAAYVSKLISRVLPEGVTAHMLRHRFASRAYAGADRDIRAVQELLGHASVATTQIYTYVPSGAKRAGVAAAAA